MSRILALALGLIGAAQASAQPYAVLHDYTRDPGYPVGGLVEIADGRIFGTTESSVYILTPDGSGGADYSLLRALTQSEGFQLSSLIHASDGSLYGTTRLGGDDGRGTVFRIEKAGPLTRLHSFSGPDGSSPSAALVEGPDGAFYGTTFGGGAHDAGTLFRIDSTGALTTLHDFDGVVRGAPAAPLIVASDGALWGTTSSPSTIFRSTLAGTVTTVHALDAGVGTASGLLEASDGLFYGTTYSISGAAEVAFHMDAAGNFVPFFTFPSEVHPSSAFIEGTDGKLYGTTAGNSLVFNWGAVYGLSTAGDVEWLHSFSGPDGAGPRGKLLEASDAKFYGAASNGGVGSYGTIFRLDSVGAFELLRDFGPVDGAFPNAPLVQGPDQHLYGLTGSGGAHGLGTAFRLDLAGGFTLLHSFDGTDACYPGRGLVAATDGDYYGVSTCGGDFSFGSFFKMDVSGAVTLLASFTGDEGGLDEVMQASDGYFYSLRACCPPEVVRLEASGAVSSPYVFADWTYPSGVLAEGPDGALYGTTAGGGANGMGSVFRFDPSAGVTELHSFSGLDGATPLEGLTLASDGWFYGTTRDRGFDSSGTVFRIDSAGAFEMLYAFRPLPSGDAAGYPSRLVEGADGSLYGTTSSGGAHDYGAVFRIDALGNESVVHAFTGGLEGGSPLGALLLASDGLLYGTAAGGSSAGGVVFRLDSSSVLALGGLSPASGPASGGTAVTITGSGLQPGAAVHFGTAAATGVSALGGSEIVVTTPAVSLAGSLYHVAVSNPDGAEGSLAAAWFADFLDVPQEDIFHASVEKIFRDGVTAGCGEGLYCRDASTTRAQMAVFLLRARYGVGYAPPAPTGLVFADVPADAFAAAWIEDLAGRGIAAGCGGGNYCPADPVTRAQMAVFLLKTLLGSDYEPPAATGTVFDDVAADAFAAAWIEDLHARGVTAGCSAAPPLYCPSAANSRGQMAVFVVKTFGLP